MYYNGSDHVKGIYMSSKIASSNFFSFLIKEMFFYMVDLDSKKEDMFINNNNGSLVTC